MKNSKTALALLVCASTIFAQETAPKTLPELIEYAKKNLSDFSITSSHDRYIIYRHIAHDLEWISRSDSENIQWDIKRTKDTILATKTRLLEHRSALLKEQSAAQQEMQTTAHLATIANDLKVCNAIAAALNQIKL